MRETKKSEDKLKDIKKKFSLSKDKWSQIHTDYYFYNQFISQRSLEDVDLAGLRKYNRPTLDFNILEAHVNRLIAEFSNVMPEPEIETVIKTPMTDMQSLVIQKEFETIFEKSDYRTLFPNLVKNQMGCGYAVFKIVAEYETPLSFKQVARIKPVKDPTEVYFDPTAKMPCKEDAKYCFEVVKMTKEDFEDAYPDVEVKTKYADGWIQGGGDSKLISVLDWYEYENYTKTALLMANDISIEENQLEAYSAPFIEMSGKAPEVIKKEKRVCKRVVHYKVFCDKILEKNEIVFDILPIIYIDGSSYYDKDNKQYIRPYYYNAIGAQRSKNHMANIFLDEILNLQKTKIMIPERGLPSAEYLPNWIDPNRKEGALVYKDVDAKGQPVAPPMPVQQAPIPPELIGFFRDCTTIVQEALGNYDAAIGINNNQLSGRAIIEASIISNSASKPFFLNMIASLSYSCKGILKALPKLLIEKREYDIKKRNGNNQRVTINNYQKPVVIGQDAEPNPDNLLLWDAAENLDLSVKMSTNFEVQRQKNLDTIIKFASTIPAFQQLLSNPQVLSTMIIENLDMKGAALINAILEEEAEQAKNKPPQAPPPDVQVALMSAQTQLLQQQNESKNIVLKEQQIQNDKEKYQTQNQLEFLKIKSQDMNNQEKLILERSRLVLELQKIEDNKARSDLEVMINLIDKAVENTRTAALGVEA